MDQDRDCSIVKSFLSPSVHKLLVETAENYYDNGLVRKHDSYLNGEELTFNWRKISPLIEDLQGENYNIHKESTTVITDVLQRLWPIFVEANIKTENLKPVEVDTLRSLFKWTRKEDIIMDCLACYRSNTVGNVEAILLLTSILERSLGNVFLLKGHNVPFLLRDLLSTQELKSILGQTPVVFLQLLVGTPVALNLRNIVWHGFPNPNEIRVELAATLFVTIASIGSLMAYRRINLDMLPCRHQVSNMDSYALSLQNSFPNINEFMLEVRSLFVDSQLIAPSHFIFWEALLDHHKNARYGYCVLLLLPQLEHMLRNVFCKANGCPERMLTAESTSFYVTLDEILAEYLNENEPSKVRMTLGDNILEMLRDVLVYQEGPRLRDKVSHGECNVEDIPNSLSNHVICIALAVIYKLMEQEKHTGAMPSALRNSGETALQNISFNRSYELRGSIVGVTDKYIPVFHPSTLLKKSITECLQALNLWKILPWPCSTKDFEVMTWEEVILEDKMKLKKAKDELSNLVLEHLELKDSNVVEELTVNLLIYTIQTLFRPKCESEVLTMLRQINDNVHTICRQVKEAFEKRYTLYTCHSLRSRQRETYCRMLKIMPQLYSAMHCVVLITLLKWMHINEVSALSSKEFETLIRHLRNILQYVQNVMSLTHLEKNRWEEIGTLTMKFSNQISNILMANKIKFHE